MKYLEVIFGDNDFGWPVRDALIRLWTWIHRSNARATKKSMGEMFKSLQNKKLLLPMLNRLVDSEVIASHVEFATRGVHDMDKWPSLMNGHTVPTKLESITSKYLTLDLKFHTNKKFTKKWQNGEHACLNLNTGQVQCF